MKKTTTPKHILALPTLGQKIFVSELLLFEIPNFDSGHSVLSNHEQIKIQSDKMNGLQDRILLRIFTVHCFVTECTTAQHYRTT